MRVLMMKSFLTAVFFFFRCTQRLGDMERTTGGSLISSSLVGGSIYPLITLSIIVIKNTANIIKVRYNI